MPKLPPELAERPGIVWLYLCKGAGLSLDDLKHMRIDQAEAIIELSQFMLDSAKSEKTLDSKRGEKAFFG